MEFLVEAMVDVVLLDAHMERMDGYETARRIMETRPLPIVMCSSSKDPDSVAAAFLAYEAGAVAVVEQPVSPGHPEHRRLADALLQTVRLMSEVKVVRRWPQRRAPARDAADPAPGRADPRDCGIEREERIGRIAGGIFNRQARDAGQRRLGEIRLDRPRVGAQAIFEVAVDRDFDAGGKRAEMIKGLLERHAPVAFAQRRREPRAGGGHGGKAEARQQPRAAQVPRVRHHEAPRLVKCPEHVDLRS